MRPLSLASLLLALAPAASAQIRVDGRLDEPEWQTARRFDEFVVSQPYTLGEPALATVARMVSTPEGIAVFFECAHPASVPRLRPRVERDQRRPSDRVNFIIDFDADGRVAYDFAVLLSGSIQDDVVTNEVQFNSDWNPDWTWAVDEDAEGWRVELLIPWSITAMRDAGSAERTVAVYFDRVIGATEERQAFPAASFERGRFVSDFHRVGIPQYRSATLHVFPYVTARQDFVGDDSELRSGADLFWKPSAGLQLSATLNPDFGQVEADELVVNFDAIESYFSDKRAFFTENQGTFDLRTPDAGQLVYTRRIGGERDDGSGLAADIDAAIKLNGSLGRFGFGVLGAQESDVADADGRRFLVQRLLYPLAPELSLGYLGTWTDRPLLQREAQMHSADVTWKPHDTVLVNAQVIGTQIDMAGLQRDGQGAWLRLNGSPSAHWLYEVEATHFDRALDFNDLGFLRRASFNELEVTGEYRGDIDDPLSRLRGWRTRVELQGRSNDSGDRLPGGAIGTLTLDMRSGAQGEFEAYFESSGIDDLIARGNGLWRRPARQQWYASWRTPVRDGWQFSGYLVLNEEGLEGRVASAELVASWFPLDALNMELSTGPLRSRDWLIWEGGRDFGRYQRQLNFVALDLNWFPALRHEVRMKMQWLAISAWDGSRYVLDDVGRMQPQHEPLDDFVVNNFGLQLRYRFELAAQSDLFLVYSRGGIANQQRERDDAASLHLLEDALALRDADQFLAKVRYRF